jgi:hypothetical protein
MREASDILFVLKRASSIRQSTICLIVGKSGMDEKNVMD